MAQWPMKNMRRRSRRRGVTFTEILMALLILGTAGVSLIGLFFSGYGHIAKAETHRHALGLAEELMAFTRASITIENGQPRFCGQVITLPVQFRSPVTDPVYLSVGFPSPSDGFAYTIDLEDANQDGSTSDGEELLILPNDPALALSIKKLVRRITITVLFEGNRTLRLQSFVVNTHDY